MSMCIGTAGWSIPRAAAPHFQGVGTHLQRYARVLRCAEINSSFHRPHAPETYAKWARSTPRAFRFSVKLPRAITHDAQLKRSKSLFESFLRQTDGLGSRRGPLLVQLPPSLAFDARVAGRFFEMVRTQYEGTLVCEPRHASWLAMGANDLLVRHRVARVAADPAPAPGAQVPGGWTDVVYYRWHGSPRKYWSSYDDPALSALADALREVRAGVDVWCVFDNTASGAAIENARTLAGMLR